MVVKTARTMWYESELESMFKLRSLGATWEQISQELPNRTADAIRLEYHRRWTPELQATLSTTANHSVSLNKDTRPSRIFWTPEEDSKIRAGLKAYGKQWRKILAVLPGRSVSSVRNRAKRLLQLDGGSLARGSSAATPRLADKETAVAPVRSTSVPICVQQAPDVLRTLGLADGRRSRNEDPFDDLRRSRRESRRDESELEEFSNLSILDEGSSSLKSLGFMISASKGSDAPERADSPRFTLDELEAIVAHEVVVS